jgi:hypothetical protein
VPGSGSWACVRLRVNSQITIRDGKGEKDRVTILPPLLQANLLAHLERIKAVHGVKGIKGARLYGIPTIHSDRR